MPAAPLPPLPRAHLPWIETIPGIPYFRTEDGMPWHPIGHNEAISWRELNPLFGRKDLPAVEAYLRMLAAHGVTVLRLMLEYAQVRHRYFETAPGKWSRRMVQFWDDLFALCEQIGLRILLTPFDTFWMWIKFEHHPYNTAKGGPLSHPSRALLCGETRKAIKARLTFAAERWGGSGALFAWDVWNEIHPAQAEMSAEPFQEFIQDLSEHLRAVEQRAFGRTHPQTVSLFGPELRWRPEMQMEPAIFRHPSLDFATIHIYEEGTIDHPRNTVDAAAGMGRIVEACLGEIGDQRAFFDSEHGPIHTFKDKHRTLPEAFDDEYFRHMQWAHLASGGAGGGMRWPNRRVHTLTPGMHRAQAAMARFLPALDWMRFDRRNLSEQLSVVDAKGKAVAAKRVLRFGCGSAEQALVYLLRRDCLTRKGQMERQAAPLEVAIAVPGLAPGSYAVECFDPGTGASCWRTDRPFAAGQLFALPPFRGELLVTARKV